MKTQRVIHLTGYIGQTVALPYQGSAVEEYRGGKDHYFRINKLEDGSGVILETPKGRYDLSLNKAANIYNGIANGVKVHVTLKKTVGKLIYWA